MSSALKNLPPNVRRELLRHVRRPAAAGPNNPLGAPVIPESRGHKWPLRVSLGLLFTASTFPLLAWLWIEPLNARDAELTPAQIRRGAFLNSGSRDVGRDPDWDFETGKHKFEKGYGEIDVSREQERTPPMGPLSVPIDPKVMRQYDSDRMTAVARGLHPSAGSR